MASETPLRRADWALLAAYCFALFGVALVSGRPLTLHEAVLPESAREMLADGDWIVPKKGGEPWLESPPLPQWCTVAVASVFGRCDAEWIVRIGPALVATFCVCLTAWMAAVWYGRVVGLLSGLILATTCEFTRYAWLAEDEIYLCGIVTAVIAWFVRLEFVDDQTLLRSVAKRSFFSILFGSRPWPVIVFFVLLGMTNLAKGLIFGTAMAAIPIAGWLVWNRDWPRWAKYTWVWGAVIFMTILAAWPLAARWRHPDVVDVWVFDLGGRATGDYYQINQPVWYYPVNLLWMLAPWTLVIPFGFAATWNAVKSEQNSPARFLWGWAFLVPLVFSIPGGKHHHYLLHALAPWAVIAGLGMDRCRQWLAVWPRWLVHPVTGVFTVGLPLMIALAAIYWRRPEAMPAGLFYGMMLAIPLAAFAVTWGLHHREARIAVITLFTTLFVGFGAGHWYAANYADVNRFDVGLLKQARQVAAERGEPIVVDLNRNPLSGFLDLFYLPEETAAIHNVSFLVDEQLPQDILLLTSASEQETLNALGRVKELGRSQRPLRRADEASRLLLLQVHLNDNLVRRRTNGIAVSPMQAMQRVAGPMLR